MAAQDLTTLAAVREHLQISDEDDTASDDLLESLITAASDAVVNYTQRRFLPAETAASKDFLYAGRGVVSLAPYVARSVTSVVIDPTEDNPTTLTAAQYQARPLSTIDAVFTRLIIKGFGVEAVNTSAWPQERVVRVTGNWGYTAVPSPVERACVLTVAAMFAQTAIRGSFFEQDAPSMNAPALPGMARALLSPYRVHAQGA
jgi:hypothetical protein